MKVTSSTPMGVTIPAGIMLRLPDELAERVADRVERVGTWLRCLRPFDVKAGVVFEIDDASRKTLSEVKALTVPDDPSGIVGTPATEAEAAARGRRNRR